MLKKISNAWAWMSEDPIRFVIFMGLLAIGGSALIGALISWVAIVILFGATILCIVFGLLLNYFFPFIDPVKLAVLLTPISAAIILYLVF